MKLLLAETHTTLRPPRGANELPRSFCGPFTGQSPPSMEAGVGASREAMISLASAMTLWMVEVGLGFTDWLGGPCHHRAVRHPGRGSYLSLGPVG
jgi:hypothetical protein